jgi:hypothetical protein
MWDKSLESNNPMETNMDWSLLLFALIMVESGGHNEAIGDNGRSLGCLQIQQCVIDDVNRLSGTKFVHKDALDRQKAIKICMIYLSQYSQVYEKATGKKATFEVLARIWNGGPYGYKKASTIKYWLKVKEAMELIKQR